MPSEFDLRLTVADLTLLDKALGAMPYKDVAALIVKINAQIDAQTRDQKQTPGVQDESRR